MKRFPIGVASGPQAARPRLGWCAAGALSIGLALAAPAFASDQPPPWTLHELGSLGGWTRAAVLNEAGLIAGGADRGNGRTGAFVAGPPGFQLTPIEPPGSTSSFATGINDRGMVVGYFHLADGSMRTFVTGPDATDPRELPRLPGSAAAGTLVAPPAINDAGQVAGTVSLDDGSFRFYITGPDAQGVTDLGPASYYDQIAAISSTGRVLSSRDNGSGTDCFLSGDNGAGGSAIGVPAGMSCNPVDVDDDGRVLAQLSGPAGWGPSFVTGANGSGISYLPDGLFVEDMNGAGVVIGSALATGATGVERHAFVTGPGGVGMTDLNDVFDIGDGDWLAFGYAVNDSGWMLVESNGGRAFAVTVVPELPTAALLGIGLLLACARRGDGPRATRAGGRTFVGA